MTRTTSNAPRDFDPQSIRWRILGVGALERPDVATTRALQRLGAIGLVDIGRDARRWPCLWQECARLEPAYGLRLAHDVTPSPTLPSGAGFVVVEGDVSRLPPAWRALPWIAQIVSVDEIDPALAAGAFGFIVKGQESGGLSGDESAFVLLQRTLEHLHSRLETKAPVWCQGGIGLHTAAAVVAGGATGVVLDALLLGHGDGSVAAETVQRLLRLDGSEPRLVGRHQVLRSDGQPVADVDDNAVLEGLRDGTLLAAGQDLALARLALASCANLEALVRTLQQRLAALPRQARALKPLAEDSAWARSHGTRFPIAQGPMTRVSDTAEFAAAVADAGALPFLALSLMRERDCRTLMTATRVQAGDRPWGVGVLGFAAPEILEPQLALVRELKPSVLLLAGGRPSQARPFVELGIPTYLHVPSPGLLDLFLKEDATHFIFEGRECGGHVGPRYSFVLWEQAVSRLCEVDQPEKLHVLFAGGIHDARSAAMVATLAAPLAARGAKIGVLMGTAYIATTEAVRHGAVLEEFQQRTMGQSRTAIVETAPGHAIRCVASGFVDLFEREKARLRSAGADLRSAAGALESLTVGRLRIATKGLDRIGDQLVEVPAAMRDAEGMYMIGQVIALQRTVTTLSALHRRVCDGATAWLDALQSPRLERDPRAEAVAIVGMACLYPGAPDLETFWSQVLEGRDAVTQVPPHRWRATQYYDPAGGPDKSVSQWGGFIPETPFDPLRYGIPPQSLAAIEPVQLLSLEVARRALDDAGYATRTFDREKTSVIFGAEAGMDLGNEYTFRNLYPQYCGDLPPALAEALPTLTEDSFPGMLVNVISGRIANRLGLGGVNYAVTSACASSLTAVELAVKELRTGSSDLVLAGGADFHNGIADFLMFSSVGALSRNGRCKSFDAAADGIALGEGVGVVVLKRLEDAERDGDRIYAVIEGIAGSSDGKGLGLTAPRKEGQKRALERTYWQAGVLPAEVGLVEAHGTGTVVGDRTELRTLTEVYVAGGAVPSQAGLGSVKSQIGHTKCAAGIAGMIKIAKALHHRVLPPTGQVTVPNPAYRDDRSPFQLNRTPRPWHAAQARAAVSAFGFGGTNFHALLTSYAPHRSQVGAQAFPAELFAFRGSDRAAVIRLLRRLEAFLSASNAAVALRDMAAATWADGDGTVQLAFVADGVDTLRHLVEAALNTPDHEQLYWRDATGTGRIAALFPGQGSQYTGMLRDLFVYFPGLLDRSGADLLLPLIYPQTRYEAATRADDERRLTDTRVAQPALGLVMLAAYEWLSSLGFRPDMTAGHSYGELVALAAAGSYDSETLLALSDARATAITAHLGADRGAMAAVRLDAEGLRPLLAAFPNVVLANQNSPIQTVIAGPSDDVDAACTFLGTVGVASKRIDTDCAFHSPLMAPAEAHFRDALSTFTFNSPRCPVYSNASAAPHDGDVEALRTALSRHIVSPVRFVDEVERLYADGARVFVEIGPRTVLTGLLGRILKGRPHTTIALDAGEGFAGLLAAAAQLAVTMPGFDANAFFAGRCEALDLDKPLQLPATTWFVDGGRARPLAGPQPAPPEALPVALSPAIPSRGTSADTREQALTDYLQNMRDLVHAQRDVLLGYLGATPVTPATTTRQAALAPAPHAAPSSPANPAATTAAAAAPVPAAGTVLRQVIAERTGYPLEMLEAQLDLEADLSIDSIKRLEIVGELSQRLGLRERLGAAADTLLEQLSALRTLDSLETCLARATSTAASDATEIEITSRAQVDTPVADILIDVVSRCTGYPAEALDPELDLEADLSIDSIKRLEVIGQLAERLQLNARIGAAAADALRERMSAQKSLSALATCVSAALPVPSTAAKADTGPVMGMQALIDVVSRCTGYPASALEADLDLEADLSIDSIKRVEIIGQLADRLGAGSGRDRDVLQDALASRRTLREMADWLDRRTRSTVPLSAPAGATEASIPGIPLERYVLRRIDAPRIRRGVARLDGKRYLISDDCLGLAPRVAGRLRALGADVEIRAFHNEQTLPPEVGAVDGLIHLWSLNPANRMRDVKRFFAVARAGLLHNARQLLVASALGGDFGVSGVSSFRRGGGFAGLIKTVAKEFPELRAHWIDFDLSDGVEQIADHIESELLADRVIPEVAYQRDRRYVRDIVPTALTSGSMDGLPLNADSTVLLTGGARGITALIAIELAQRYRCHLEVVGRSPIPTREESALTRDLDDPRALRQALLTAQPGLRPAQIEQQLRDILADRAARETYARVIGAGGSMNYTQLDVRDARAFMHYIGDVYRRRGRIDGVIHGAGVVEDKLVRDKTDESFSRVFDTKVGGAMALSRRIRDDVKFVVFFSSVASAFGNRGQVDYASANDVLDKLAHDWQRRISGRVLSVNWGPWADTGMVNDALRGEYARRGIGLIPQREGVEALLRELSSSTPETQIVLMCGRPEDFTPPDSEAA